MRVCEIAGFMLFGLKAAKSIENTGVFRGDTWWHPVCKKTFGFPWLRAVASLISSFGKTSSHYTWTKGCHFGGCFEKNFASSRNFFSRVMPYAPMKIRSPYCTDAAQKDLSLSYRNMRGEKTTRFFGFSQKTLDTLFVLR